MMAGASERSIMWVAIGGSAISSLIGEKKCVEFMKKLKIKHQKLHGLKPELYVIATGGAYKFHNKIRDALGVDVLKENEMECLIIGIDILLIIWGRIN